MSKVIDNIEYTVRGEDSVHFGSEYYLLVTMYVYGAELGHVAFKKTKRSAPHRIYSKEYVYIPPPYEYEYNDIDSIKAPYFSIDDATLIRLATEYIKGEGYNIVSRNKA